MSRRPATVVPKVAVALLSAVVLTACGTGLNATTYKETGRMDGASANVGGLKGIAVRHLHVAPPPQGSVLEVGGTALVLAGLSNGGTEDDALVSASTTAATDTVLTVAGREVPEVPVVAGQTAPSGFAIRLDGLVEELHVGESIEITLVFREAGRVTLAAALLPGDNGLEDREEAQDPYEGGH